MKWARVLVLGLLAVAAACAGNDVGSTSEEDDAGYPRLDAGRRDTGKDTGGTEEEDSGPVLVDAGKKDSSVVVKDATVDTSTPDVNVPDTFVPPDASFVDVFVDAGPVSATLVINEIDYDQPVNDDVEFVEIFNKSSTDTVDLTDLALAFFNGSTAGAPSTEYYRIDLGPGSLTPGEYLLVRTGTLDAGAAILRTFSQPKNNVQNGERDSVVIVNKTTNAVIDAVTYEPIVGGAPPSNATFGVIEGKATSASDSDTITGSLIRHTNGTDTNDNGADFKFTKTPTPGAANQLSL